MAVTFTLVNPNDSTPANNQVVVDVTLQPAVECHVEAELSSPDTDLTIGRTYVAAVRVTNTGVADLHALAVVFGDVQGYEVRPITTPVWDADSGLVVTNPDWKSPALQPGAYLVALKHALPPGATAVYYARIVRRSVETEQEIFFDVYGPCGYTGVYAALEFGGGPTGEMWLLLEGWQVDDNRPAASNAPYVEEDPGSDTTVTLTLELQTGVPAGTYLVVQRALGGLDGAGGLGLYLDLDSNPTLTYIHSVEYLPALSGYERVWDSVYSIDQPLPAGVHTFAGIVRVNNIPEASIPTGLDYLPMRAVLSTSPDVSPGVVPDAITGVTSNTLHVLVTQPN